MSYTSFHTMNHFEENGYTVVMWRSGYNRLVWTKITSG